MTRTVRIQPTTFLGDALAGLSYMWRSRTVRAIRLGYVGVVAFNGIDDLAVVFLATETLQAGQSAVGLLLGAVGFELFVGYALLSSRRLASMTALLPAGLVAISAGNLLTGRAWAVSAAFVSRRFAAWESPLPMWQRTPCCSGPFRRRCAAASSAASTEASELRPGSPTSPADFCSRALARASPSSSRASAACWWRR